MAKGRMGIAVSVRQSFGHSVSSDEYAAEGAFVREAVHEGDSGTGKVDAWISLVARGLSFCRGDHTLCHPPPTSRQLHELRMTQLVPLGPIEAPFSFSRVMWKLL